MNALKWFFKRSALLLSICVLGGLAFGWFLPATQNLVFGLALAQIVMAVVVLLNESMKIAQERGK